MIATRARRAFRRQIDQRDCGAACLHTVLRYHGGDASFGKVRELAATTDRGASMAGLAVAAEALGFTAEGVQGTLDELAREQLPAVAHVRTAAGMDHFVVVFAIGTRVVLIGDPASRVHRVSRAEFESMWQSRAALLMSPGHTLRHEAQPSVMHWLRDVAGREADVWIPQIIFAGALYTALALSMSAALQYVVDKLLPAGRLGDPWRFLAVLAGLQAARSWVTYWRQRFVLDWSEMVGNAVGSRMLSRLFRLPVTFFETRSQGDLVARAQDAARIQTAAVRFVGAASIDAIFIVGATVYIGLVIPTALPFIGAAVVAFAIIMVAASRSIDLRQRRAIALQSRFHGDLVGALQGIQDLRSFPRQQLFPARAAAWYAAAQRAVRDLGMAQAMTVAAAEAVGGIVLVAALGVGAFEVQRGVLALGAMIGCYSVFAAMIPAVIRLADAQGTVQAAQVGAIRLMEVDTHDEDYAEPETRGRLFERELVLSDAKFSWPGGGVVLERVSLIVRRGAVISIGGPSGAGKSTLVKLLQGKYPLTEGAMLADGTRLTAVMRGRQRDEIAVISEPASIFSGSILDNVSLGRPWRRAVSFAEWLEDTRLAGFLDRFPLREATAIGESSRQLSAGERQIVAVLRALYDEPSLIVVDEGLNTIDEAYRAAIIELLIGAARRSAMILISHDRELLNLADERLELRDGRLHPAGKSAEPRRIASAGTLIGAGT